MKKLRLATYGMAWLWIIAAGICCSKQAEDKTNGAPIVTVDELVKHPDDFKGVIGVTGTVNKVDESKAVFTLSCEDACIAVPVTFPGKIPVAGNEVTVFGQVAKAEGGKYVFAAREIKTK